MGLLVGTCGRARDVSRWLRVQPESKCGFDGLVGASQDGLGWPDYPERVG